MDWLATLMSALGGGGAGAIGGLAGSGEGAGSGPSLGDQMASAGTLPPVPQTQPTAPAAGGQNAFMKMLMSSMMGGQQDATTKPPISPPVTPAGSYGAPGAVPQLQPFTPTAKPLYGGY